jgi:hypothetical protein
LKTAPEFYGINNYDLKTSFYSYKGRTMQKLTPKQFESARAYMHTRARSLERARFIHLYEGESKESVQIELAKFQNNDGGFGHALEPDMWSPSSSSLATEVGLRTLLELGVPSDNLMIQEALKYLQNSIDPEKKTWRVAPLDVNEYPHAPWWHDDGTSLSQTFDEYKVIPRAGILASLLHFAESLPQGWLEMLIDDTTHTILNLEPEAFGGGGDTFVYAQRLAQAPGFSEPLRDQLIDRLGNIADQIVTRDPDSWTQYCVPPLKLAPTPDSIAASKLSDCLPAHLDYLIETQHPEGYWDVTWSWSEYPDEWKIAKSEWRGILTLEGLGSLSAYGRLEGS